MSDKKQTELPYWKNELDKLDSLPGETELQKNAAWEKLDGRLNNQKPRSFVAWYWAAACTIAIVSVAFIFFTKNTDKAVTTPLAKIKDTLQSKASNDQQAITQSTASPVQIEQNKIVFSQKEKPLNKTSKLIVKSIPAPSLITAADQTIPLASIIAAGVADTTHNLVAIRPPVKKLRVVHINEIENTAPPTPEQLAFSVAQDRINTRNKTRNNIVSPADKSEYTGIKILLTN